MVYRQQLALRPVAGRLLDRAAFGALLLLAVLFAFESTRPLIKNARASPNGQALAVRKFEAQLSTRRLEATIDQFAEEIGDQ